ncbi:uncharacterized protein DC041_0012070 [Schistosoma bovis]|uniref:Uncharacterized protein n=1 Tax=Schistosoma bovis TaxID=6184 RepID=A0A430QF17_SCHBO|nr:uncharacterized protein DC041_0012070 [Schistosoma bovis]
MLISLIRFTAKPISCYTCLNCTKGNQNVIDGCGGCVTTHGSGVTSKFCGPTCDQLDHENTVGCCSTDKCNGMTKLSIHRHVAGENYSVHRICLRNNTIPTNFPKENLNVCQSDLCNNRIIGDHLNNSVSYHTCLECDNITIYMIIEGYGGCVTTHGSGVTSKLCGPTCDQLDHENTVGCCSTDKCNGMTKLSIHRHVIVVLFVCMGISKYIL